MDNQMEKFKERTDELIKYLNENFNPHTKIIIQADSAEIVNGVMAIKNDKYIYKKNNN